MVADHTKVGAGSAEVLLEGGCACDLALGQTTPSGSQWVTVERADQAAFALEVVRRVGPVTARYLVCVDLDEDMTFGAMRELESKLREYGKVNVDLKGDKLDAIVALTSESLLDIERDLSDFYNEVDSVWNGLPSIETIRESRHWA